MSISELELQAFFANRGIKPEPWEVEILVRLDKAFMHPEQIRESP